jgi:hypothetical protein
MAQIEGNHLLHKGSPRTAMTGGKSPKLLNDVQTFAIKWGLSQLSDLINPALGSASLGAINTAWQTPLTPGLDELYQGQLDNVLFAWERITSPVKALWGGDVDFQEYFERGSSVAYTLSSIITLQTAIWKSRAYHGFKGQVLNGYPWVVDVDTGLGERNGWEFNGVIYVDQIHAVSRRVDRKGPLQTTLTIGEDKDKADPLLRVLRALQGVYAIFGAMLGENTLFG